MTRRKLEKNTQPVVMMWLPLPANILLEERRPSRGEDTEVDEPTIKSPSTEGKRLYLSLQQCKNRTHLKKLAKTFRPFPYTLFRDELQEDDIASFYLPFDSPPDKVPVRCLGDGNCLYRAASTCLTGSEGLHIQLRCQVAAELMLHPTRYISDAYLRLGGCSPAHKPSEMYCMLSSQNDQSSNLRTVVAAGRAARKAKQYSCMLSVIALANVLQRPVRSVYPTDIPFGPDRRDYNRLILPYNPRFRAKQEITLMWTPSFQGSRVNHFVPLI